MEPSLATQTVYVMIAGACIILAVLILMAILIAVRKIKPRPFFPKEKP